MGSISSAFGVLAWILVIFLILCVVAAVFYMRWRAAGQERGI